jgi:DnaJ-class molecular chaperone
MKTNLKNVRISFKIPTIIIALAIVALSSYVNQAVYAKEKCDQCNGKGKVECWSCSGQGKWKETCPTCNGKQVVRVPGKLTAQGCKACGGTGKIKFECNSCNGKGKVSCSKCGGKGKI